MIDNTIVLANYPLIRSALFTLTLPPWSVKQAFRVSGFGSAFAFLAEAFSAGAGEEFAAFSVALGKLRAWVPGRYLRRACGSTGNYSVCTKRIGMTTSRKMGKLL